MPQAVLLDDLQKFFTAYAQAFRSREPDEVVRFLAMPLTRVTTAKQSLFEDEEAAEDSLARLIDLFEANGIANARIATIEVGPVGEGTVDVNVHWELLDDKDAPVIAYDVGYSLVQQGEHRWRISTVREDGQNRAFQDAGWSGRRAA